MLGILYQCTKSGKISTTKGGGPILRHGCIIRILRYYTFPDSGPTVLPHEYNFGHLVCSDYHTVSLMLAPTHCSGPGYAWSVSVAAVNWSADRWSHIMSLRMRY